MEPCPHIQDHTIHTLDLNHKGIPGIIASYMIPHKNGAVLVECGPGSTLPALQRSLKTHGLNVTDVTDVFLTHIHLDHAGAAGWLARQGARIHVHPNGAPHMLNPEKLLASAYRIYGDEMETTWGKFLPVPEDRISVLQNGDTVEVGDLIFRALETPGHANHHFAYLFEEVCFSGDIGGVRLAGLNHVSLPMPPPEFHLEKWRESLKLLGQENITCIAPAHFGIYSDPDWYLAALAKALDEVEEWIEVTMPSNPPIETLNEQFLDWTRTRSLSGGLDPNMLDKYEAVNPYSMSSHGLQRYWRKFRSS